MKNRTIFEALKRLRLARCCKARHLSVGLFLFLGTYGATPEDSGLPLPSAPLGGAMTAQVDVLAAVLGGPFFIPAPAKTSTNVSPSCRSLVSRPSRRRGANLNRGPLPDYRHHYLAAKGNPPAGGRKSGDCCRVKGSLRGDKALNFNPFHISSKPAARRA